MALVKCKECGNKISKQAKTCPSCGKPQSSGNFLGCGPVVWFLFVGIGSVFYFTYTPPTPTKSFYEKSTPENTAPVKLNLPKWRTSKSINPVDDSPRVVLSLIADIGKSGVIIAEPVNMIIRCESNKTQMYLNWHDYLGSDNISVITRIGESQSVTKNWSISTDSKATFYIGSPISHIKQMMKSDQYLAKTTPYNESPVTAIFDTKGLSDAIKPLRETCHW